MDAQLLQKVDQRVFSNAYLIADEDAAKITINFIVLAGELDNQSTRGLAHYTEHLAWYSAFPKRNRLFTGENNAWTYSEITHFKYEVDKRNFDESLDTLYRIFAPISVSAEFAVGERQIILREHDASLNDFSTSRAGLKLMKMVHGDNDLMRDVLGTVEDINSFTLEKAKEYHKKFYRPDNTILLIEGDIDSDQLQLVLKNPNFKVLEAETDPAKEIGDSANQAGEKLVYRPLKEETIEISLIDERSNARNRVRLDKIFKIDKSNSILTSAFTAEIAENILNSAMSGGLRKPLHFTNFIAKSLSVSVFPLDDHHASLTVVATPDKGVSLSELQRALVEQLAALKGKKLSYRSFDRAKSRRLKYYGYYWNSPNSEFKNSLLHTRYRHQPVPMYDVFDQMELIEEGHFDKFWQQILGSGRTVISQINRADNKTSLAAEDR